MKNNISLNTGLIGIIIVVFAVIILAFPIMFFYNQSFYKVFGMPEIDYYTTLCILTLFRLVYFITFTSPSPDN